MSNPNNCTTCDHKLHPAGGHCHMFRDAPTQTCMQHTMRWIPNPNCKPSDVTTEMALVASATAFLKGGLGS